ncbi:MAG: enoyl-CoA hydratase-related protein, partial [Casimicrobiaceae bacterium]
MNYEQIRFETGEGIARITLNRPDRLNSFTAQMHAELRDVLARVTADAGVRALLLTGAGRGFCAGQDLADRAVAPGAAPVDL